MTLDDLAKILIDFTNQHYAEKDLQPFFLLLRQLSMRGLGIGIGADVGMSGEALAMTYVRDNLATSYPGTQWNIFDVGANIGQFITRAVQVFANCNCHFFSFEPASEAFRILKEATKGLPQVTTYQFGFGEADKNVTLYADKPGSGLASVYKRRLDHYGIPSHEIEKISLTTLDRFVEMNSLTRVHFLKLDVEGHELKCFQGAARLLNERRIDHIQFEFGGTNIDSRTFFQDFWYALPAYHLRACYELAPDFRMHES